MFIKIILFITLLNFSISGDFCNGFESGYVAGYCYNNPHCITPVIPNCPLIGIYEKDTYTDGYNKGFLMGFKKQK